ncbi:hypothetical protein MASR2M29_11720 [Spirochaetota bacterium]
MEMQSIITEQYIAKRQKTVVPRNSMFYEASGKLPYPNSQFFLDGQSGHIKHRINIKKAAVPHASKTGIFAGERILLGRTNRFAKKIRKSGLYIGKSLKPVSPLVKAWLSSLVSVKGVMVLAGSIFAALLFSAGAISAGYQKKPDLSGFSLPGDGLIAGIVLDKLSPLPAEPEDAFQGTALPATVSLHNYTIKKNDTLDAIARNHGLRMDTLISVNNLSDARRIIAGNLLKIPSQDGIIHLVKKGENLAKIAAAKSVSVMSIIDANDLDSQTIAIGQSLFIPGARLSSYDLKKALGQLVIWPVKGELSSYFGYRANPFTGMRSFHNGIDIVGPLNMQVKAAMDGKVAETGFSSVYGNYVILVHPEGYQTLYAHLNAIKVKQGLAISQGSVLGLLGTTGYSTGPHVHFSVFKNGNAMDPLKLLK